MRDERPEFELPGIFGGRVFPDAEPQSSRAEKPMSTKGLIKGALVILGMLLDFCVMGSMIKDASTDTPTKPTAYGSIEKPQHQ